MGDRTRAVPLPDVLALVERRRRARARLRAARAHALGVGSAGLASAIVLVVRDPRGLARRLRGPRARVLRAEARLLAQMRGVPGDPEARVIVAKALHSGTPIDPADPDGALDLLDRFAEAGCTEQDAAELADL